MDKVFEKFEAQKPARYFFLPDMVLSTDISNELIQSGCCLPLCEMLDAGY